MSFKPTQNVLDKLNRPFYRAVMWLACFLLAASFILLYSGKLLSQGAPLPLCTDSSFASPSNPSGTVPIPVGTGTLTHSANCRAVNCSTLSIGNVNTVDDPTLGANCFYMSYNGNPLPPCKTYTTSTPQPRVNCADIIDLPLCSALPGTSNTSSLANPGVNCVKLCSDPSFVAGASSFNTNCTIPCNDSSFNYSNPASPGNNCRALYCHQITLVAGTNAPTSNPPSPGTNCNLMACNLLTADEISPIDQRFSTDSSHQYCDGSTAKCYTFFNNASTSISSTDATRNSQNLYYVLYRQNNTMCQMHNCQTGIANCPPPTPPATTDDVTYIGTLGDAYKADYITNLNAGLPLTSGLCNPVSCQPIVQRTYLCGGGATPPTTLDASCDTCTTCSASASCPGTAGCPAGQQPATCNHGYCTKQIDCNVPSNSSQPECIEATIGTGSSSGSPDIYNAWLFRPTPILTAGNSDLCYPNTDTLANNGVGANVRIPLLNILLGYFDAGDVISPGLCGVSKLGTRGQGYIYLKGANGLVYSTPDNDVGYIKGVAWANYNSSGADYGITACLRYANAGATNAAGSRECRINCGFSLCTQWCGFDVCHDMTVSDGNEGECMLSHNSADLVDPVVDPHNHNCAVLSGSGVDNYVRMRAVKYGRKICVFLDQYGNFAYDNNYMGGNETLPDSSDSTICIDDNNGQNKFKTTSNNCQGHDSNENQGSALEWRTIRLLQYIGNPTSNPPQGYVDNTRVFYPEQDCAMVPLRIGPPPFYNVATTTTSQNLFSPPLYIKKAHIIRGSGSYFVDANNPLGVTDFFYPEIVVQYGETQKVMSLGAGYIGNDINTGNASAQDSGLPNYNDNHSNSPASAILTTNFNGITTTTDPGTGAISGYWVSVFVAKRYDVNNGLPIFCLYQKVATSQGQAGPPPAPVQIDCVNRTLPNPNPSGTLPAPNLAHGSVSADPNNAFNAGKIDLQLIAKSPTDDGSTTVSPSADYFAFTNPNINDLTCNNIEQYQFCSSRDYCSQLLNECAQNQVNLYNNDTSCSGSRCLHIQQNCNSAIFSNCNVLAGIQNNGATDYFSQNSSNSTIVDPYAYGWFDEICITSGFNLPNVCAMEANADGIDHQCFLDVTTSASTCNNGAPTYDSVNGVWIFGGGNAAKGCHCQVVTDASTCSNNNYTMRTETPREAGLCIDIPHPKFCPAISYTSSTPPNTSLTNWSTAALPGASTDLYYTTSSLSYSYNNSYYGPTSGVITAANYSTPASSGTDTVGVDVSHWNRTIASTYNHAEYPSVLAGERSVPGTCNGFWKLPNADSSGIQLQPLLSCQANGTWARPTSAPANNSCIRYTCPSISVGNPPDIVCDSSGNNCSYSNSYTATGETGDEMGVGNGYATWPQWTKTNDFLESITATSCITGFQASAAGMPTRACQQNGVWDTTTGNLQHPCVRRTCPGGTDSTGTRSLVNPPTTQDQLNDWINNSGASFPQANASRSSTVIESGSVATGTCNNNLGFYQGSGSPSPTRDCNSLGQWGAIHNPCVTDCSAITDPAIAGTVANGFATWPTVDNTTSSPSSTAIGTCISGYVQDPNGPPTRLCSSTPVITGVGGGASVSVWGVVTNPCINGCPSGTTVASTASNGSISLSWPATFPGVTVDVTGPGSACSLNNLNGSNFAPNSSGNGRLSGQDCYFVERRCGTNGVWGDPTPMCVTGGQIGLASYEPTFLELNQATTPDQVSCVSTTRLDPTFGLPRRQCVYTSGNSNIDQVYLQLVTSGQGSVDCVLGCAIGPGVVNMEYSDSVYTGPLVTRNPGESTPIGLTCQTGYCSYSANPTATCGSNGHWHVANDCTGCR